MNLSEDDARERLAAHGHGTLGTVHPDRGVDAIPVVYVVHAGRVGIPIDRVKPKAPGRLQRERNLDADPRATLLIDHWDADDWSRLWWVRAQLRAEPGSDDVTQTLTAALAGRFAQYRDPASIARVLTLRIEGVTGWAAAAD